MARIGYSSRCRIAIEWYDNEAEADERARSVLRGEGIADANIGIVQCGRDKGFDRTVDGQWQYAVVTP